LIELKEKDIIVINKNAMHEVSKHG
jgi:hypothetical protein